MGDEAREMIVRLDEQGENLGTRALGQQVRSRIVGLLQSFPGRIVLDFAGVQVMTQSFADELFRKLPGEVQKGDLARLAVRNISDDVRAVLRYATSRAADTHRGPVPK